IFTSTNKVYGDLPNNLPLMEQAMRWELPESNAYFHGIDETMSIDQSKHSLFGASKASADLFVQEYGRYFGMKTVSFRGGCLTGPNHSGAELHGFLAYLMKCCVDGRAYQIFGYKGKQVRDNIHAGDLVNAFWQFYQAPRCGEVYNIGGGRANSCSILEAIALCERICGKALEIKYAEQNRSGDHIWYISSFKKFQTHFPDWKITIDLETTLKQIHNRLSQTKG
ncbi:MAG TPA: NAD-dependent epimerase/dehydratase family protein, partial [Candidatus Bathyarchaeia archaeon]|nr:NAD-dependent epimerase/dehydratase family protein [Candidatus Bathyarchaeia archaeon]